MRRCFGLIILLLATHIHARTGIESKTTTLVLRGRVPASTSIEWDDDSKTPQVKFNHSTTKPKVEIHSQKDHRKITITHP